MPVTNRAARRSSALVIVLAGVLAFAGLLPSAQAARSVPSAAAVAPAPAASSAPAAPTVRTVKKKKGSVVRSVPSRVGRNQAFTVYVRERPAVKKRIVRVVARQAGGAWRTLGQVYERKRGKAYVTVALPASGPWQVQAQLLKRKKYAKKPGPTYNVFVATDFQPVVVAHRGGAGEATQNSMSAYTRAIALGYSAVETDVQLTAASTANPTHQPALILFHDPTFENLTNIATIFPSRIKDTVSTFTPEEVAELTLNGTANERVPTFDSLLAALAGKPITLHAEAKNPIADQPERMLAAIKTAGMQSQTIVSSFDLTVLNRFRTLRTADTSLSTLRLSPILNTYTNPANFQGWASGITLQQPAATTSNINDAHARGLQIYVWTVDDPTFFYRFADARADAIITDVPGSARAALTG